MKSGRIRINRILGVAISFLLFRPSTGHAQESSTWTLKQCIDNAIENNIQIKQTRLGVQRAAANLVQSKANLLPKVNANATHGYNFGPSVDPFTNDFVTQ